MMKLKCAKHSVSFDMILEFLDITVWQLFVPKFANYTDHKFQNNFLFSNRFDGYPIQYHLKTPHIRIHTWYAVKTTSEMSKKFC